MSDYSELLAELRSKWIFPRSIEAADLIERLIRERDEARAKAIDEAAAAVEHWSPVCGCLKLVLALKDKPTVQE